MSKLRDKVYAMAVRSGIDPTTGRAIVGFAEEIGWQCPKCGRPASHSGVCGYYHTSNTCPMRSASDE